MWLFRLLLRAGGIQDRLLGMGYGSVVWFFLPMLATDTGPLSRAPVLPLLPAPYRAKGVDWAFEIPIRPGWRLVSPGPAGDDSVACMTQRLTQSIFDPWPFSCLAGICTAGMSVWMLSDGIRVTPDGWEYWEGSISILLGHGYRYYGGAPIEAYPPLFSLYLSAVQGVFSISGRGLVVAVTLLAAATSAVWVAVFNRLARPAIGFSWTRVFLFFFVVQFVAYS